MSKILFVWELGSGLGHLTQIYPLAQELIRRGDDVTLATKDLVNAYTVFKGSNIKLVQSPVWLKGQRQPIATQCFSEILLQKGYIAPDALIPMIQGWLSLFKLINPDAIVFNHAPTALMASRKFKLARIVFGTSYLTPPAGSPSVDLRPWDMERLDRVAQSHSFVVSVINQAANSLGLPQISRVSDLYDADREILLGFRETDFYHSFRSKEAIYLGGLSANIGFPEPSWETAKSPRIFAYLKKGSAVVDQVLRYLNNSGSRATCFFSGAKKEDYQEYESDALSISTTPLDTKIIYKNSDIVICHAGAGTISSALQNNCALLLLPTHLEQTHNAILVEKMGAGVVIYNEDDTDTINHKLKNFFKNPKYKNNAKKIFKKYKSINEINKIGRCVNILDSLILKYNS